MRTKAAIIDEIMNEPIWFEELQEECAQIEEDTGVKVDPLDLGLLQAVYADRNGLKMIGDGPLDRKYQDVLDKYKQLSFVKTVLKRYPELEVQLQTMWDPEGSEAEVVIGIELIKRH